ncbi:FAD-binding oxidoreductase [Methylobacterium sp. ARG-1]|uniref:FAD-binding oxidoreductase n=1 Tax=Methylobacterium sp. ARG-1 TaxID=1692501 RepID=UPI00068093B9|nr:FAD-binding oxidoreductase [Methylobacterium sp. ARG-1]KNY24479.1 2-hydroxyacid dehydrogenase [Methylobacterium sp. ARG-1]
MEDLFAALESIVGPENVLRGSDKDPFLIDWLGKYRGDARAVVRPADTAEVASIVEQCSSRSIPIVPQGGNTSLSGGATPDRSGEAIVLSLARLNKVRSVDPVGNTIAVDAGTILSNVQAAAAAAGRYFPMSLGAEGSCTIGGNLSANAGGVAVLRYGTMRELTLGLEVVLADGRVWDGMTALQKDNTGYSLRDLFIGSEGTLGIITGAVLKLFPSPAARATAFASVSGPKEALSLLSAVRSSCGDRLTAFEFMTSECVDLVRRHVADARMPFDAAQTAVVLIELSDIDSEPGLTSRLEDSLAAAIEAGLVLDAVVAQDRSQAKAFWRLREGISEALVREGGAAKHDVSLPVAAMADFVGAADVAVSCACPGVRPIVFGHLGDGNLHYNLLAPLGMSKEDFAARCAGLSRLVHDETTVRRGSISAEHGVGQLRAAELVRCKPSLDLELMQALKATLDPRRIFNPGKLLADC